MEKGKFIVIDGLDGSGKGTQIFLLAKYIFNKSKERDVFITREPHYSKYGKELREILKKSKDPMKDKEKLTDLFILDRKEHIKLINSQIDFGSIVISDRYKYSTICYQNVQGMDLDKLIELHKGLLVPDLVIIIDLPAESARKRITKGRTEDDLEIFDKHLDFLKHLRDNYLALPKVLPDENIVIVNGDQSIDLVSREINKLVDKIIL